MHSFSTLHVSCNRWTTAWLKVSVEWYLNGVSPAKLLSCWHFQDPKSSDSSFYIWLIRNTDLWYMYWQLSPLPPPQALGRRGPWCVQSEDSNHDPTDSRQEVPQFWLCSTGLLPWPGPQRVQTLALPGKIQNEAPHHCCKDTNIPHTHSEYMHRSSAGHSFCRQQ